LFEAFSKPQETIKDLYDFIKNQVMRQFESFGKILEGIFTLDFGKIKEGFSDLADQASENIAMIAGAAQKVGERFEEAYKKGQRIDELQKQQEQKEIDIIAYRATQELQLKRLQNIQKDQLLSADERNKAIEEGVRIAKELQDRENEILDIQIEQLKIKQSLNDTSREEEKLLDELIAKRIDSSRKADEVEKKTLTLKKQMNDEANANEKAANDARLAAALELQKVELERFRLLNEGRQSNFDEEIQFVRDISAKRLAILEEEFKQGKKSKA